MKFVLRYKGGSGSGNWGHKGRPGLVGGSMSTSKAEYLARVIKNYSRLHDRAASYSYASERLLHGERAKYPENEVAAKAIMNAIRNTEEVDIPLYRSVYFDHSDPNERFFKPEGDPYENILNDLKPGDTFNLDRISSFSSDERQAAYYGAADRKWTNYQIKIIGNSKSFNTDALSGLDHKEYITFGKFEVVSVDKTPYKVKVPDHYKGTINYKKVITIKQVGVF